MKLITKEQAQELDRIAIDKMGIPGVNLMGNAGKAVSDYAQQMLAEIHEPKIAILCGKGNNAGDGYKTALDLNEIGINTQIFILSDKKDITGDSLHYYNKCIKNNLPITHSSKPPNAQFNLIIDALLGTGFKGELRSPFFEFTNWVNNQNSLVLSVDIPSGVDANNGIVATNAIQADATVTMGMIKVGMMIEPAKSHCGKIIPVDIGFPDIYNELAGTKFRMNDENIVYSHLKSPAIDTHKHRQGKVLIVAGSRGMTGAGILASRAAIRCGAGLVTTCAPLSLSTIYETNIIEGLTVSCNDNEKGLFTEKNFDQIAEYFDWADVLLIGPGLGKHESTISLVKKIVTSITKPIVIDADGLQCFVGDLELFNEIKNNYVITPHFGEFANLLNVDNLRENLIESLDHFMSGFGGTLVAKNAPTLVADGNEVVVNSTGNQGLATGGTGDVLAGIIASFIAQGIPTKIAGEVGVFIHGKAADIIVQQKGYRGLIASDLIEYLPQVIKTYE